MSKVRLCTEILSTGIRCTQIALRGQPWCRAHSSPKHRERNADARELIGMIAKMNVFSVASILENTVYELRTRAIPPLQAEAIFEAATTRLEQLINAEARAFTPPSDRTHNLNQDKGLHAIPVK